MNEATPPGTRPYEVIAYGALGIVMLIQLNDGNALGALLSFGCGVLAMIARMQMGPIFYLVLSAGGMLAHYNHGVAARNVFRPAFLDINDIILCAGVLAFVAVHYRLQGIWYHHLAWDPRRRAVSAPLKSFRLSTPKQVEDASRPRRSAEHVSQVEVSWLIFSLPVWALAAQFIAHAIPSVRIGGFDPWLIRMLLILWGLALATFVAGNLLDLWKRYMMSPSAAWIFLQDTLWRETRGEQRQLQRWLAWKRMRNLRK